MKQTFNNAVALYKKTDYFLFFLILLLVGVGLNILLASTSYEATVSYGDPYYFIKKQSIFVLIGSVVLISFSQISYKIWEKITWPYFGISILLLILVFIPGIGREAGGAHRWITVAGFSIQPSDPVRFGIVLVLARMYTHGDSSGLLKNFLAFFFILIIAFLIKKEPDLGTSIQTVLFSGILLIMAGYPVYVLMISGVLGIPVILLTMSSYQLERIRAFLDPYKYRFETAFQLIASYKSFLSGGFWGQGLGEGLKRHNLQARHTDFILAIVAEDLGTIGIVGLLMLYMTICLYSLMKLMKVEDSYGRLLGTGIILLFIVQAIMNVAVVMGLLPTTGLNLPLVSYGGTSILSFLAMFGILLNILKENQKTI
ncbi:MAG: putative lipid II flippase FtsW [Spirochaetia bacterium]|nr:putative lipid II flippase FtsW [Spirochaetia bacterium]